METFADAVALVVDEEDEDDEDDDAVVVSGVSECAMWFPGGRGGITPRMLPVSNNGVGAGVVLSVVGLA